MKAILVTGGAGFIGSNISEALVALGHHVIVLDNLSTGSIDNIRELPEDKLTFINGDIGDSHLLKTIIESNEVSLISHQAAIPSVAKSIEDPISTLQANVIGTANLLHIAAQCKCKRVVFASSSSIYGDTPELPKRENMPFNPKSPYALSKATTEMLADIFTRLFDLETVGLRYFNVYGRRQNPNSDYAAVIPKFISRALVHEDIPIEGDGLQTRDFTYIDDVVRANILALTAHNISGMVFNIAYSDRMNILSLAEAIKAITNSRSDITYRPPRPGDVRDSFADIEKAQRYLNYTPEYSITDGLKATVDWYRRKLACIVSSTASQ